MSDKIHLEKLEDWRLKQFALQFPEWTPRSCCIGISRFWLVVLDGSFPVLHVLGKTVSGLFGYQLFQPASEQVETVEKLFA